MVRPWARGASPVTSLLVILTPSDKTRRYQAEIERWADERPYAEVRRTDDPSDARRWAREAAREGVELVVAGGGDGTVHEVANGILGLPEASTSLGVLPLGTGNDLARGLQIPLDLREALEVLEDGSVRPMDVIGVRLDGGPEELVLNALTGGFSGQAHEALDQEVKEAWGPLSYLRSGVEMWGERRTYALELEVDGETLSETVLNFMVCNGPFTGGGIAAAAGADLFDGFLDVVLIRDADARELSTLAAGVLSGKPVEHRALVRREARAARVVARASVPVSVDGEVTEASQMAFALLPGRLPVVVPGS